MSTAAPPVTVATTTARPPWGVSLLGAGLGCGAGALAASFVVGAVLLGTQLAGAGPVEDGLLDALAPLSAFALVPIAVAVVVDAILRREIFWLLTGFRARWFTSIFGAVVASGAAFAMNPSGGAVVWVVLASTVLLRWGAVVDRRPPRWFARPPALVVALAALAALAVAVGGFLALQVARPAIVVDASREALPQASAAVPGAFPLRIENPLLVDASIVGSGETGGIVARLQRLPGGPSPLTTLGGGESAGAWLTLAPATCPGEVTLRSLRVRYRVLGVERTTDVDLRREYRARC